MTATAAVETGLSMVQYQTVRRPLPDHVARELHSVAGAVLRITPDPEPGWWCLTPQAHVGSLSVAGLEILIRPKIPLENLFVLLEVGLPPDAWRREATSYATSADLLPSVIAFFARTVETTLARGVRRSYLLIEERRLALRGRIDISRELRGSRGEAGIHCRFDEYTAAIVENRYLRATVRLCLRMARVYPEDRRRLLQQMAALEEVDDVAVRADDLDRIPVDRLNEHYLPALRLARLILENLTLVDRYGAAAASSFLLDMNKLFERFVTERLRRLLQGRLDVAAQRA
jgi:5-methylcytosine-specific restriction enzyme subunit McrC